MSQLDIELDKEESSKQEITIMHTRYNTIPILTPEDVESKVNNISKEG